MMAGGVRRDGLREEVTKLRDEWRVDQSMLTAPGWMVRDACVASVARVLDAVPDVPPDPPAAARDELARVLHDHPSWTEEVDEERTNEHSVVWRFRCAGCKELLPRGPGLLGADSRLIAHQADALSGVLVDAADVRARALEDLANRVLMDFRDKSRRSQVMRRRGNEWSLGVEDAANIVRGAAQGKPAYFYEQDARYEARDRAVSERDRGTT